MNSVMASASRSGATNWDSLSASRFEYRVNSISDFRNLESRFMMDSQSYCEQPAGSARPLSFRIGADVRPPLVGHNESMYKIILSA